MSQNSYGWVSEVVEDIADWGGVRTLSARIGRSDPKSCEEAEGRIQAAKKSLEKELKKKDERIQELEKELEKYTSETSEGG